MAAPLQPNRALELARTNLNLSRSKLARRVADASKGQITPDSADRALKRLETGEVQNPTEIYRKLISQVLHTTPQTLFGPAKAPAPRQRDKPLTVTCRKYVPVMLTPAETALISSHESMRPAQIDGIECSRMDLPWPHDEHARLQVTVFTFGSVVAELRQTTDFTDLADLAVWRHTSYEIDRPRVDQALRSTWPTISTSPEYVLGTWWLARSPWSDPDLDTAMRIMSTPSALLRRQGEPTTEQLRVSAEVAERAAWTHGFEAGQDLVEFGVSGVSVAYASWSGVAYAPLAVDRALHPDELGDFETLCQGLWALCHGVCETVEQGDDPAVDATFGWRWLRGMASRITRPRPTETRQLRSMRDAVIDTSQLRTMLPSTIELLRDATSAHT